MNEPSLINPTTYRVLLSREKVTVSAVEGVSLVIVPSDRVSAAAEPPLSFFITPIESGMPSGGTAVPKKVLYWAAEIGGMSNLRLFAMPDGKEITSGFSSLMPPSVQAFAPMVAGMTSSCACTGAASAASSRTVSLAREGGG